MLNLVYDNRTITFGNINLGYDGSAKPDYNPLGLPAKTIRIKLAPGSDAPTISDATVTAVQGQADVYDVHKDSSNWSLMLIGNHSLLEVLGANTSGVTNMNSMFTGSSSLTSVPLFDTSSVTNMGSMFNGCTSLISVPLFDTSNVTNMFSMIASCSLITTIPLFDTSKVTNMYYMCSNCVNVESGALALYQQASTQANPPSTHTGTFNDCGSNTVTGAAELAQIPSDWGGTAT